MPLPVTINDLSKTAGSNFPDGGQSPATLDDTQRAHGAFIAQLRDGEHVPNATAKTTLVDADLLAINDSAAANILKKITWANIKAAIAADSGSLSGFRNKIENGNFSVNQLAVSGTVTLGAGGYGHDRWKAGASGCTYTFATVNNITTLTITAGSLQQIIKGDALESGTHVLSWTGTAQGKIGAGSYAASGVTGSVTGGANLTVEFGTGTLSKVQLEFGTVARPFELRQLSVELFLCQRYYEVMSTTEAFTMMDVTGSQTYTLGYRYQVPKHAVPTTITLGNNMTGFAAPTLNTSSALGFRVSAVASATAAARIFSFSATIDARL